MGPQSNTTDFDVQPKLEPKSIPQLQTCTLHEDTQEPLQQEEYTNMKFDRGDRTTHEDFCHGLLEALPPANHEKKESAQPARRVQ